MSENPLKVAHGVVQERKAACGMPELAEVLDGERSATTLGDGLGMWSGTDLTEADVNEAAMIAARAVLAAAVSGAVTLPQAICSAYIEGLLVGVEHGRKLGS